MTRSVISEELRITRLKQGIELLRTGHTLTDVRRLVDDETADYWWNRMRAVPITSTDPGWTEWCKARRASLDTAARSLTVREPEEPSGVYCACSDPACPTPEGQYTHG